MLLITGRRDISTGISDTSTEVRRYWYVVKRVAMIESILQACSLPECQYDFVEQSNRKDKTKNNKEILQRFEKETTGILLCIALSFW